MVSESMNIFSENVNRLMTERRMSQGDLAALTGMHRPNVNRYLNVHHSPNLTQIERIASALGVAVYELLTPDRSKNTKKLVG